MNASVSKNLPVAVIGAGPVGLAAAAHLVQRGLPFVLFEAAGDVSASLAGVRHVRLFSPWRFNVDRAARALLAGAGVDVPDGDRLPSAAELIDHYLQPLAQVASIQPHLHLRHRVLAVSRAGADKVRSRQREASPFVLRVHTPDGERDWLASAVIDATGTWHTPNALGVHGLPALGEAAHAARMAHGMPDILGAARARYAGRRVLVVGAGHSAAGNLLSLVELKREVPDTRIVWAVRGNDARRLYGGGSNDGLAARGALGSRLREHVLAGHIELRTGFAVRAIETHDAGMRVLPADETTAPIDAVDEIVVATGSRPDLSLARELRVRLDPWLESTDALAPLIDPNEHSCGTVRPHGYRELAHEHEPGYFAIGAKSYGRAPNFLLATGYEQARSVVAWLAGDRAAADDVQLDLPQTGVCSTDLRETLPLGEVGAAQGCCGGAPKVDTRACCVRDEVARQTTGVGCGCGVGPEPRTVSRSAADAQMQPST